VIVARLSIRVRITLGTFLLALAFFSGAAILVHRQVESVLDAASVAVLRSDASPYLVALRDEPGEKLDAAGDDELIAVRDGSGETQLSTLPKKLMDNIDAIDFTDTKAQTIAAGSRSYLVLVSHETTSTGTWTVIAARTEAASRLVLDSLTRGLIIGFVSLTLLFTLASWLLTSAALRPITRLRRSADELVRSGEPGLLPVSATRDEVHDLATTLNTLIDDLHESAEREKQLVSDASHELRTPLAVLQAQLELLRAGDASTFKTDVAAALRATERMSSLVTELLELSRVESMGSSGASDGATLTRELAEAVDRARFAVRGDSVSVEFSAAGSDGVFAIGAHDFGRLVDNLVSNAVTAGASSVLATIDTDDRRLLLTVVDDGRGLPEDFLPRAFDRFSQPDDGRQNGTGLGLAIVAAIVAATGGSVTLENGDRGARATVIVPVRP
jgi:signal transduction histidine kinase